MMSQVALCINQVPFLEASKGPLPVGEAVGAEPVPLLIAQHPDSHLEHIP